MKVVLDYMDNDQTVPQSVAEAGVAPQNERLKLYQENVTKAISEKIQPFKEKMNPQVAELLTKDHSQEKDYKIEVIDNPWSEGIVHVQESWDGGSRNMRVFDERYKPLSELDSQPGNWEVGFTEGKNDWDSLSAGVKFDAKQESLRQEINCTTERATGSMYGQGALMSGEFFKHAGRGPMTEKTYIQKDGTTGYERFWSEESKWLGPPDRYQTTRVVDANGVISKGTRQHGIVVGVSVPMEVVSRPAKS